MDRSLMLGFLLATIACGDADESYSHSVILAATKCGQSPSQMQWLANLIKKTQEDVALSGNIYAVTVDGHVIFVHQPVVMSCIACVLYDCDGNRIELSGIDIQSVVASMGTSKLIYSPY